MSQPAYTILSRPLLDERARKLLDSLRGYSQRQDWAAHDRAFLADLLGQWDLQVTELLNDRVRLHEQIADLQALTRDQEWRLARQGWGRYLKFLVGASTCP